MVKKAFIVCAAMLAMSNPLFGQTYWKRTVGGNAPSISKAFALADGSLLMGGKDSLLDTSSFDAMLAKMDPCGRLVWRKTYGTRAPDTFADVVPVSGGGFALAFANSTVSLAKLDSAGTVTRVKTVELKNGIVQQLLPCANGEFILAVNGYYSDFINNGDVLLCRLSAGFDTLHTRIITAFRSAILVQRSDGNILVLGSAWDVRVNEYVGKVFTFTPDGDTMWFSVQNTADYINDCRLLSGDTLLLLGLNWFTEKNMVLSKRGPRGGVLWYRTLCGPATNASGDWVFDPVLHVTHGSNMFICADMLLMPYLNNYTACFFLGPDGTQLWRKDLDTMQQGPNPASFSMDDSTFLVATGYPLLDGGSGTTMHCLDVRGNVRWKKQWSGIGWSSGNRFVRCGGDRAYLVFGDGRIIMVMCDQRARKNELFAFKIPVAGDSLSYQYSPLSVPAGMTVSKGGTMAWTPPSGADSVQYIAYRVSNGAAIDDTLSFYIRVSDGRTAAAGERARAAPAIDIRYITSKQSLLVRFPGDGGRIDVFDVLGRRLALSRSKANSGSLTSVKLSNGKAAALPPGRYLVRASWRGTSATRQIVAAQ